MNADFKKFGMASAAALVGVIGALLVLKYGEDLPVIKQARDAL